jgi:hypothetical protein
MNQLILSSELENFPDDIGYAIYIHVKVEKCAIFNAQGGDPNPYRIFSIEISENGLNHNREIDNGKVESVIDSIKLATNKVSGFLQNFNNWYFDIASENGNVKIAIDRKGKDSNNLIAVTGILDTSTGKGEVFNA